MQLNEFEIEQIESSIKVAEKKLNLEEVELEGHLYGSDKQSLQRSTLSAIVSRIEDIENKIPNIKVAIVPLTESDDLEAVKTAVNQISDLLNGSRV